MERREFIKVLTTNKSISRDIELDKVQALVLSYLNFKGLINVGKCNYVIHMGGDKLPIQGVLYGLIDGIYDLCRLVIEKEDKIRRIGKVING